MYNMLKFVMLILAQTLMTAQACQKCQYYTILIFETCYIDYRVDVGKKKSSQYFQFNC